MIRIINKNYSISDIEYIISNNLNLKYSEFENKIFNIVYRWINKEEYFLFKTSGSTGKPKEIKISRNKILVSIKNTRDFFKLEKNMNCLLCISTDYVGGFMMLIRALEIGMNIYIIEPISDPFNIIDKNTNFDFSAFVPLQIYEIIKNDNTKYLSNIKKIIIGGASINYYTEKNLEILNNEIYSAYGMTETISHIALRKIGKKYFQILGDTEIKNDVKNCLIVNGKITDYTDLITNDIVEIINNREFIIKGRIDNIINSGSYKIYIDEIEKLIEEYFYDIKYSSNFFIDKLPDNKFGETCNLFIEDNYNKELLNNTLEHLKNKINKYEIPKNIFFIDKFKYTNSSKIDKFATKNIL